jgi:pilus assembly protein CpaC
MISGKVSILILTFFCVSVVAQQGPLTPGAVSAPVASAPPAATGDEQPNGKRIRRHLSLIVGLAHDEEFLIPDKPTVLRGRTGFLTVTRIKGTDYFRILPEKIGSGIVTLNDVKTQQILVEIRFDIRDDANEKMLRELQSLLGDIEGIEFKYVNGLILIDGYVLLPRDLVRIGQIISNYDPTKVKSLATLSPAARQRIANFISNDVNNPEVKITAVGDYIKLEGQVNSPEEKLRIKNIVSLYLPDLVVEKAPDNNSPVQVFGRKNTGKIEDLIVDLITIKRDDEKVEPPPKLIQVVAHFVKFADGYSKSFSFNFSPAISATTAGQSTGPTSSITDTARLISNLLPKLSWAKVHGFAKVLDTASILVQDRKKGVITRTVTNNGLIAGPNGSLVPNPITANVTLDVTPTIKSERSGLIEMPIVVSTNSPGKSDTTQTTVNTTISVRDRQSAAFGGIIKKDTDTRYGAPATPDAIITLQASKEYARNNSQFVVFVTPIIKSSASTGVEQVKKKFRLRD